MLIEREVPLQKLRGLADQARLGRGAVALVSDEAGIGKTTLLNAFQDSMRDTFRVIRGGYDPLFTPRTFGPIHDMGGALGTDVEQMLATNTQPSALFTAILTALDSTRQPTIFICEDVHWADNATLDLIKFLGRRIQFIHCLLVVSFRSDEVNSSHPLTQALENCPVHQPGELSWRDCRYKGLKPWLRLLDIGLKSFIILLAGFTFDVFDDPFAGCLFTCSRLSHLFLHEIQDEQNSRLAQT